jgi:hypothetical protein
MNIYTEKNNENKSQAVAHTISQKQSTGESAFQKADNRPEALQMQKLQEIANNSPQVKQLKTYQSITNNSSQLRKFIHFQNHADKTFQPLTADKNAVVQGRFIGTYGAVLSALNPVALGAVGTYYNNLWTTLNALGTDINIEDLGGAAHFNPTTNTLNFRGTILRQLMSHRSGVHLLTPDVLADHIALLTHELSHAHDSLIMHKELKSELGSGGLIKITNVMMTEVQAWEREARTRQRLLPEGVNDPLWDGWFNLDASMLANYEGLQAHKDTNEVIDRYYRYLRRELNLEDGDLLRIKPWFDAHGETVRNEMIRLSNALIQARNTI